MKRALSNGWKNLVKLFRFLIWYAIGVAVLFGALPPLGTFLETRYEAMNSSAKILVVLGFFLLVAAWQLFST